MPTYRDEWSLHTSAGRLQVHHGSNFGFDRGWAPQGAGRLVVALADWRATGIPSEARVLMHLQAELLPYGPPATLGATFTTAEWPTGAPAWYRAYPNPYALDAAVQRTWQVWLYGVDVDDVAQTATLEVATWERRYVEMRNGGDPWMPTPTGPGGQYLLDDVWTQLAQYVGLQMLVEWGGYTIAPEDLQPWATGESAWDWLNTARLAAGRAYVLNAETGSIRFVPRTVAPDAPLPSEPLLSSLRDEGGRGSVDGQEYADAVTVVWTWDDAAGAQQQVIETRLAAAAGITSWRQARSLHRIDRRGQPIAGYTQSLADALYRWKVVRHGVVALGDYSLLALHEQAWQSVQFSIDDAPSVAITSIGGA